MQKMEENTKNVEEISSQPTWDDVFRFMVHSKKAEQDETLASEIIKNLGDRDRKNSKAVYATCLLGTVATIGLLVINYHLATINEKNNQKWIDYISQYDFVSQDGEGTNYYNSDVGGDVTNGAENPPEEKPQER